MIPIIQVKRPLGEGWRRINIPLPNDGYEYEIWVHANGFGVVSAVEVADKKIGPAYHLSISRSGKRCNSNEAKWVLDQFGLTEAEEDNHVPSGLARHFWRPVADKLVGLECECKESEPAIKEDKGDFIWRGITK